MNTEDRTTELEIKFAQQEDTIAELNDVILSQQKIIDGFESRLLKMESELKSLSVSNSTDPSEEPPPPHY